MRNWRVVVALVVYVGLMLDMTLRWFPDDHPPPNLVPFDTIAHDLRVGGWDLVVNLMGNVVAFLPLGALLWRLDSRRSGVGGALAVGAGFSALIETAQFLSGRRVADVDDILLNAVGTVLGLLVARRLARRAQSTRAAAGPSPSPVAWDCPPGGPG